MRVAFRTDAALEIGTGHVMRCLTLADALRERGAECVFICREHNGHLAEVVAARDYDCRMLPAALAAAPASVPENKGHTPHAVWLGADWCTDARETLSVMQPGSFDLLVVDHYAIDREWESALRLACEKLMVIDDLADRQHDCDFLLDQNLGRTSDDYRPLVPSRCSLLLGPRYALLRPEFSATRDFSLARRAHPELRHLLITMGGVDKDDVTSDVLAALRTCGLPGDCRVTVVMGSRAPWVHNVRDQCSRMQVRSEVRVDVADMAALMADADLAIGAAGSTSWERCALGLPSLVVVLAQNQSFIADALAARGAARAVSREELHVGIASILDRHDLPSLLSDMSRDAAAVTDGLGARRVVELLTSPQPR